jgi:hypothetical protein
VRDKGVINEKQTKRQLHINDDEWVHCVSLFMDRGTIEELSVVLGQMQYGFVKPRGRAERTKQVAVEKTVAGAGADAPQRGTPDRVTTRASRPKGPGDKSSQRRSQAAAGRTRKGRRGAR